MEFHSVRPVLKKTSLKRRFLSWFLIFVITPYLTGCRYFRVKNISPTEISTLDELGKVYKRFLVHHGDTILALDSLSLSEVYLFGQLSVSGQMIYYVPGRKKQFSRGEKSILQEVHIFLEPQSTPLTVGEVEIPLQDIQQVQVIERNDGKSVGMTFITILAAGAVTFAILYAIALATKTSCPYVYVENGQGFVFAGEIFGGAIAPNLERDDYLPLPDLVNRDGQYHLRISNELKERQYTDIAELLIVEHPGGTNVVLDRQGKAAVWRDEVPLTHARTPGNEDVLQLIQDDDDKAFLFSETDTEGYLSLTFQKPQGTDPLYLLLKAKNSFWLEYISGEIFSNLGSAFDIWEKRQAKISPKKRWDNLVERQIPLQVAMQHGDSWRVIENLPTVGPMMKREMIVPLPTQELDSDVLSLRVSTGFMFWEVDQARVVKGSPDPVVVYTEKPARAMGTGGINWKAHLEAADGQYMAQEEVGDYTVLDFEAHKAGSGNIISTFLHTRGYYELIRDYSGLPNLSEVLSFQDPGFANDFSRERYMELLNSKKIQQ